MGEGCQVDFYLLGSADLEAERLACRLALMAWERGHRISIVSRDAEQSSHLDQLLWQTPEGRFVPHEPGDEHPAPIRLLLEPPADGADVVINLTDVPVPLPVNFNRLLEIVPHRAADREASREKFRHYRSGGLDPKAHDIN